MIRQRINFAPEPVLNADDTYEDLDAFLNSPAAFAEGDKMSFAGVKDGEKRAEIIAFLRQRADAPPPLPGE